MIVLWLQALAVSAQEPITLGELIPRGFDEGSLAGYDVTSVRGFDPFRLTDVSFVVTENRWQANNGLINILGFNYLVESAYMDEANLKVSGKLQLLPDLADAAVLKFDADGFAGIDNEGGRITFSPNNLQIGKKLTIKELFISDIKPLEWTLGGGAKLEINTGTSAGAVPCPPFTNGPPTYEASVLMKNGRFDHFTLDATGLRKPLGTTGAFLDQITGTLGVLPEDDDWYLRAAMLVHGGCPITIKEAKVYPVTLHADGTITSAGYLEINGEGEIFDIPVSGAYFRYTPVFNVAAGSWVNFLDVYVAETRLEISGTDFSGETFGKLQIPDSVPLVGGWEWAGAEASINPHGFRGSVTIHVSPEIPSFCTPTFCPPRITLFKYPCGWRKWCRKTWQPPCIPEICTPRIPAVTAHVGMRFESGEFSFDEVADTQVEAWELSYRHILRDEATGNSLWFMSNWNRTDKVSTGRFGREFGKNEGGDPVTLFTVPEGEVNVIFRLTYENPAPSSVDMTVELPDATVLNVNGGPLPHGFTAVPGAYGQVALDRREAFFSIARPKAGTYTVTVLNDRDLGNFAVEQLRENLAPAVTVDGIEPTATPGVVSVSFTSVIPEGSPQTRIYLSQAGADGKTKSGPRFLLDTFPSETGTAAFEIDTRNQAVAPGLYRVVVNIDDPDSLEVESLSAEEIWVDNLSAPEPVAQLVAMPGNQKFTLAWLPSPSDDVAAYLVRYTASEHPVDYEFQKTVKPGTPLTTVEGLQNGQPYLVTIVAVDVDGYPSRPSPVLRVVPSVGSGLTAPSITSPAPKVATAGYPYVYRPEAFSLDALQQLVHASDALISAEFPGGADDLIRQLLTYANNPPPLNVPAANLGPLAAFTNLVDALFVAPPLEWELVEYPEGMAIDEGGIVMWTPQGTQVGDHRVTIRTRVIWEEVPGEPPLPTLSADQTYTLTVLPASNLSGLPSGAGRFESIPISMARETKMYVYIPSVLGSAEEYSLEIERGPEGMTIRSVPDPRTLDLSYNAGAPPQIPPYYTVDWDTVQAVLWDVPTGAQGQRVRLRAVPQGPGFTEEDVIVQDFFLSVVGQPEGLPDLPLPFEITQTIRGSYGVGLVWTGQAEGFQVQRSADIGDPQSWEDVGPELPGDPALPVGTLLDPSPLPGSSFYRVVGHP